MLKKITIVLTIAFCSAAVHAEPPTVANAQRMQFPDPLEDMRPLAVEAIKNGEAHGVLAGDTAKFIQNKMGATAPLHVNVTRLFKYNQPGCARLNAQFLQDNVKLPGESDARKQEVNLQFNYCLDGRPPQTEGKEYAKGNPFLQRPIAK